MHLVNNDPLALPKPTQQRELEQDQKHAQQQNQLQNQLPQLSTTKDETATRSQSLGGEDIGLKEGSEKERSQSAVVLVKDREESALSAVFQRSQNGVSGGPSADSDGTGSLLTDGRPKARVVYGTTPAVPEGEGSAHSPPA